MLLRWFFAPLLLAVLGLGLGWSAFQLDVTGRIFDWRVLISLTTGAAILGYLLTLALIRIEGNVRITLRDHPRHMWLVYPSWLLGSVGLGGGHGALFFLFPFAALSGVMLGNFLAIAISTRAAR